jgi:hypothetical protein
MKHWRQRTQSSLWNNRKEKKARSKYIQDLLYIEGYTWTQNAGVKKDIVCQS